MFLVNVHLFCIFLCDKQTFNILFSFFRNNNFYGYCPRRRIKIIANHRNKNTKNAGHSLKIVY